MNRKKKIYRMVDKYREFIIVGMLGVISITIGWMLMWIQNRDITHKCITYELSSYYTSMVNDKKKVMKYCEKFLNKQ